MYQKTAEEMLSFIQKNPTAFHAVATLKAILQVELGAGQELFRVPQ